MDIVNSILEDEARKLEKYKPITVDKHLDLDYDIGTLLAVDINDLDNNAIKKYKDKYLESLTRDNVQLLLNKVWELPTENVEGAVVVRLPAPTFKLPRAKPCPKVKPPTKWEQFAKDKGIKAHKKKDNLSWDEQLQKWVPHYGYQRAVADKEKDWLIEVPKNIDPMTDMFEKKAKKKSELVAKNELQRLRNIARARNIKIPRSGLPGRTPDASSKQLSTAATVARSSTASVGKFQDKLPKEKDARGKGVADLVPGGGRKRNAPVLGMEIEKVKNLGLVDNILKKRPKINMEMAVSKYKGGDETESSNERRTKGGKKNTKAGKPSKSFKKPKGGRGERNPTKKSQHGRKRR